MEKDSNLRSRRQQIYSLPPLATREPIQKADDRTRTDNLLITNQLLCQLSHIGILYLSLTLSDSYGNRTRVTAVKGRCLNRLTKEPYF